MAYSEFNPASGRTAHFMCRKLGLACTKEAKEGPGLGPPCTTVKSKMDGNSFFSAVSHAVSGTYKNHKTVRVTIARHLMRNPTTYRAILRDEYTSMADYLKRSKIAELYVPATEVEIQATADFFGLSIYVYCEHGWLEYKCRNYLMSNQGIYLMNRDGHMEAVLCAHTSSAHRDVSGAPECYGYCTAHRRTSSTQGALAASCDMTTDTETRREDVNEEATHVAHETVTVSTDEMDDGAKKKTRDQDSDDSWESEEESRSVLKYIRERAYEEEIDSDVDTDAETQEMERANGMLDWSILNRTWHVFLNELGDLWWGSVTREHLNSHLLSADVEAWSAAVTACLSDRRGGVCSVSSKTNRDGIVRHTLVMRRNGYYWPHLAEERAFENPSAALNALLESTSSACKLIPRPEGTHRRPWYFSVAHVAEQITYMIRLLDEAWWGSLPMGAHAAGTVDRYLQALKLMPKERGAEKHSCAGIGVHCYDDTSPGYLFEIMSSHGKRFKVSFDRKGFRLGGIKSRYSEICTTMAHLQDYNITFVKNKPSW